MYDVVVIGGGPGGYVTAIRAAQKGFKTALIEKGELGGTCLNTGCIPSKAMLEHASIIRKIETVKNWGIFCEVEKLEYGKMQKRRASIIQNLRNGVQMLLSKGKIDLIRGEAQVVGEHEIIVKKSEKSETVQSKRIVIATGSTPSVPPIPGLMDIAYDTTDTIFESNEVPASLTIIGGGVIGVEMAEIFSALGTKVTIIEVAPRILMLEDQEISKALQRKLAKRGIQFHIGHSVERCEHVDEMFRVHLANDAVIESDRLLVATGRKANLEVVQNLALPVEGGKLQVNDQFATAIPSIFAIGDVVGRMPLAHVASAEGLALVDTWLGKENNLDYKKIPRCVYTLDQVASVGYTEEQLKEEHIAYRGETYSFAGNGKAMTKDQTDGFVKIFVDTQYGEVLGVTMFGPDVTEIIGYPTAVMQLEGTIEELADITVAHPSITEVIDEVANKYLNQGIHS